MSAVATILAALASGAGLVMLAAEDPKRRRVHGLPPAKPRRRSAALVLVAAPGLGLALLGDAAGFTIWLGAVSFAGWAVAATPPARAEAIVGGLLERADAVRRRALALSGRVGAWSQGAAAARIAALEARVAALEAERDEARRAPPRLAAMSEASGETEGAQARRA